MTAGGLTIRAFETALRTSLADGFFKNPQVAVAVDAYRSQRVFVVGEVKTPGALPLTGGLTLMEAIARAGSTTEVGERRRGDRPGRAAAQGRRPPTRPAWTRRARKS